jgi:HK97 family phage major capsid protein
MNPSAWFAIVGKKLTTGEYLAGGPFGSPQAPMLWGRQVALTDQITATTALVGAFKTGAQIFRRGGIRVDSTNAHSDYYTRNLVCIRCEERLALSVTRPAAFAEVTSLTTTP